MKVKYSEDTDTLYITFRDNDVTESKELDENTVLDFDGEGNVCAINFEYASQRADVQRLTVLLQYKDYRFDAHTSRGL